MMSLKPGTRLGPYEISGLLGAGGMGEVYRARDTKLQREVAVKVLPEDVTSNAERLGRFRREAHLLAALNHPNIAAIYGLEDSGPRLALVMELVEGPTLREQLARGPLPVGEALPMAQQIAEGLEYAHERGIIHRDLKPANIKITPEGKMKVLDFGLGKAFAPREASPEGASEDPTQSPTLTAPATRSGVILGTAAYMAPEQARGRRVDRRADIWSFGCVLYEMLTGRRAFQGETVSDTLAGILKTEPDWAALPEGTPPRIWTLLRRCLVKDPRQRLQAIGDARIAIEEVLVTPDQAVDQPAPAPRARKLGARESLAWLLAAAMAGLCIVLALGRKPAGPEPLVVRSSITPPDRARFDFGQDRSGSLSISPDGRHVTFALQTPGGERSLWIRSFDSMEARPLPGTKSGNWPFWSPDSQQIVFFAGGRLKRIDLAGSPAIAVCEATDGRTGSWSRDGVIIFSPSPASAIFSAPAAGGQAQPVTSLDESHGETTHRWATFLPDGQHFLYMAGSAGAGLMNEANAIYLAELGKEGRRRLLLARSNVAYAAGNLLYVRDRILLAQPFDANGLELTGEPSPIAEDIQYLPGWFRAVFAVSGSGAIVYRTGAAFSPSRLTLVGRDGKEMSKVTDFAQYESPPALSPDGKRVAFSPLDPDTGVGDIWLQDLIGGTRSRLTFGSTSEFYPIWSPDGQHIVYNVTPRRDTLFIRPVNGGKEEVLLGSERFKEATDWSRDGRHIVFNQYDTTPKSRSGVWVLPLADRTNARPFVDTEFNEQGGRLSPDGRWMLYTSDDSGRDEIYVAPFPGVGGKWVVSVAGGTSGWWSRGGAEIVYLDPDLTLMSVVVQTTGAAFAADTPRPLFRVPLAVSVDVASDGQRFLIGSRSEGEQDPPLTLVTNWPAALKH